MAGKTGTTEENADAWFVGYVPQVATAVWVGHEPAKPMTNVHGRSVTGGSFPAAIFGDLMRTGLADVPVRGLPVASPDALGLRRLGELPPPPPAPALPLPPLPPPAEVPPVPADQLVAPLPAPTPTPEPTSPPSSSTTSTTTRPQKTTTTTAPTTTTTRPASTTTTSPSGSSTTTTTS